MKFLQTSFSQSDQSAFLCCFISSIVRKALR
uniref:Uncharacterized protein n=1 Tax=Arundo donax TaxID=35708 RepID=A0A0A9A4U2_ARUDO